MEKDYIEDVYFDTKTIGPTLHYSKTNFQITLGNTGLDYFLDQTKLANGKTLGEHNKADIIEKFKNWLDGAYN